MVSGISSVAFREQNGLSFSLGLWMKKTGILTSAVTRVSVSYLFIYLADRHVGSQFPDQGSNPRPLQWKRGVLNTEFLFVFIWFNNLFQRGAGK